MLAPDLSTPVVHIYRDEPVTLTVEPLELPDSVIAPGTRDAVVMNAAWSTTFVPLKLWYLYAAPVPGTTFSTGLSNFRLVHDVNGNGVYDEETCRSVRPQT